MKVKYSTTLLLLFVWSVFFVSAQEQNKSATAISEVQSEQNPSQKAQNNNTVRSNRTESKAAINQSANQDDNNAASSKKGYDYYKAQSDINSARSVTSTTKVQDHNLSGGNKTASPIGKGNNSGTEEKRVNKVESISVKQN